MSARHGGETGYDYPTRTRQENIDRQLAKKNRSLSEIVQNNTTGELIQVIFPAWRFGEVMPELWKLGYYSWSGDGEELTEAEADAIRTIDIHRLDPKPPRTEADYEFNRDGFIHDPEDVPF